MVKIPVMGEVDEMPEQEMTAEAPAATAGAVSDGAIWNPDAATSNLHLGIDVGSFRSGSVLSLCRRSSRASAPWRP